MKSVSRWAAAPRTGRFGFILTEVTISIAAAASAFSGVLQGYAMTTDQAERSAYSFSKTGLVIKTTAPGYTAGPQASSKPMGCGRRPFKLA